MNLNLYFKATRTVFVFSTGLIDTCTEIFPGISLPQMMVEEINKNGDYLTSYKYCVMRFKKNEGKDPVFDEDGNVVGYNDSIAEDHIKSLSKWIKKMRDNGFVIYFVRNGASSIIHDTKVVHKHHYLSDDVRFN